MSCLFTWNVATDILKKACELLVGDEFILDLDYMSATFVVKEETFDTIKYCKPIEFERTLWMLVSSIYLDLGQSFSLYYDGFYRLIAVHDELTPSSEILQSWTLDPLKNNKYLN